MVNLDIGLLATGSSAFTTALTCIAKHFLSDALFNNNFESKYLVFLWWKGSINALTHETAIHASWLCVQFMI